MTDNTEKLVLEHLRHIRGHIDLIADDIKELKHRLSTLESCLSLVRRDIIIGDKTGARQQVSIDRIMDRLEKIEQRLECETKLNPQNQGRFPLNIREPVGYAKCPTFLLTFQCSDYVAL